MLLSWLQHSECPIGPRCFAHSWGGIRIVYQFESFAGDNGMYKPRCHKVGGLDIGKIAKLFNVHLLSAAGFRSLNLLEIGIPLLLKPCSGPLDWSTTCLFLTMISSSWFQNHQSNLGTYLARSLSLSPSPTKLMPTFVCRQVLGE